MHWLHNLFKNPIKIKSNKISCDGALALLTCDVRVRFFLFLGSDQISGWSDGNVIYLHIYRKTQHVCKCFLWPFSIIITIPWHHIISNLTLGGQGHDPKLLISEDASN